MGLGGALPSYPPQRSSCQPSPWPELALGAIAELPPALPVHVGVPGPSLLPALRSPAALGLSTRAAHSPYTPGRKCGISLARLVFVSGGRAPRSPSGRSQLRRPLCALVPGSLTVLSALHASLAPRRALEEAHAGIPSVGSRGYGLAPGVSGTVFPEAEAEATDGLVSRASSCL